MMNVEQICSAAERLTKSEREKLIGRLLLSNEPVPYTVSDEEVHSRAEELKNGTVKDISYDEFLAGIDHLKAS